MSKETRQQKAQRLLDTNRVWWLWCGPGGATALVKGDHGDYRCTITYSGSYNCACKYGQTHPNSTDRCSHALAVALAAEKETA